MPILTASELLGDGLGRRVRIPGLPDFNSSDSGLSVEVIEGWDGTASPRAELVANGGGPGSVAVGPWRPGEAYPVLRGLIDAPTPRDATTLRRLLLQGLPVDREVPLVVLGGTWDDDKQIFVRRYDAVEGDQSGDPSGRQFLFTVPLVAPDPYKYGLTELVATAGAFESEDWHRLYVDDGAGDWYRTYGPDGAEHYRAYETDESELSDQPRVVVIDSLGTETSRRVTTTVTGPLTAGDWFIDNVETGERVWVELTLSAGQSVVLDTLDWSATLSGSPVDHLQFGPFPTLRPGVNSWRLITNGASGAGHMTIRALPAYE